MKWQGRARSSNVDDRRGSGGMRMGGKGILGGGMGIVVLIVYLLLGGNPGDIINQSQIFNSDNQVAYQQTEEEEELAEFVSVVLADTEYVWNDIFRSNNLEYEEPTLVLYSGYVESAYTSHGTSAQRVDWFMKGYKEGDLDQWDTFSVSEEDL